MSWNYPAPRREDFDSPEEYQEALDYYESAESNYIDEFIEMRRMAMEYN